VSRPVKTLALVVNPHRPAAEEVAGATEAAAAARGLEARRWTPGDRLDGDVDVLVGIGGDGTLLAAAVAAVAADLPLVGVNLGRVGYLVDIEPGSVERMLDGLVAGTLEERVRMTLEVTTADGRTWQGINDVVLEKVVSQRLVQISVEINGHYFTSYRADGIIVATPLGSTAYSLSAGGPVIDPELEALILTPVAPHSLLSRSIVLAPDAELRCTVALDRPVRVNVDGRDACVIHAGDSAVVRRSHKGLRFLSLGTHPFPQAVRHQFGLDHA
jgi:NAD+ kinase